MDTAAPPFPDELLYHKRGADGNHPPVLVLVQGGVLTLRKIHLKERIVRLWKRGQQENGFSGRRITRF